jgi:hypothetical protein
MPSVFHKELENNYRLVPQLQTESPTAITDGNHRRNGDRNHTSQSARLSEARYYRQNCRPSVITDRIYRRIKTKGGNFENFGAHFNLFPVGITDGNKCHRQQLMFRQ